MAEHPSFTLAGLIAAGGIAGFRRTGSKYSLFSSIALGASYGYAGYLVKENKDNGLELARANSVVLSGLAVSRIVATSGRAPVPWALGATGALATWYYQKKIWEYEYGV